MEALCSRNIIYLKPQKSLLNTRQRFSVTPDFSARFFFWGGGRPNKTSGQKIIFQYSPYSMSKRILSVSVLLKVITCEKCESPQLFLRKSATKDCEVSQYSVLQRPSLNNIYVPLAMKFFLSILRNKSFTQASFDKNTNLKNPQTVILQLKKISNSPNSLHY